MNIEKTSCYAFFLIHSAGCIDYEKGFVPEKNSAFEPDLITEMLGIQPFEIKRYGELKRNKKSRYNFSSWQGCKQTEPETSRLYQCENIVNELKPHISELIKIKEMFNVEFSIQIFPCSDNEDNDRVIGFSHEIIEFCYLTGTEIVVDMFLYSTD